MGSWGEEGSRGSTDLTESPVLHPSFPLFFRSWLKGAVPAAWSMDSPWTTLNSWMSLSKVSVNPTRPNSAVLAEVEPPKWRHVLLENEHMETEHVGLDRWRESKGVRGRGRGAGLREWLASALVVGMGSEPEL